MKTFDDRAEAACIFALYVKAVTQMLNVIGVDDTAAVLRNSAEQLETHRELLERAKAGVPRARGVA